MIWRIFGKIFDFSFKKLKSFSIPITVFVTMCDSRDNKKKKMIKLFLSQLSYIFFSFSTLDLNILLFVRY